MGATILELLRVFTIAVGAITALWGFYDMYLGDNGGQSSVGTKKIIGGIGFAILAGVVFTLVINDIKKAETEAGMSKTSFHQTEIYQQLPDDEAYHKKELIA